MVGYCDVSAQRANMSICVSMCTPVMWLLSLEGCVPVHCYLFNLHESLGGG